MAENVKRRVAAARLAVAFVAAGAIAGATASAKSSAPPPSAPASTAHESALNAYLKLKLTGDNIIDGSLLFKDFKKGQVPSEHQFIKSQARYKHFEKVVFQKYLSKEEADRLYIKGESNDYIKMSDADARYIKLDSSVVHGDGSVFTASKLVPGGQSVRLLDVPSRFTVDATGPTVTITNTSSGDLTHTSCAAATGGGAGLLKPGDTLTCDATDASASLQLISGNGEVATLNFSSVQVAGGMQSTVQILIGL